jgi:hypothetical protein
MRSSCGRIFSRRWAGFDLVITLEGNQLVSQATGQTKIPLYAESETKFFPKVMDAEIEFLKDNKAP